MPHKSPNFGFMDPARDSKSNIELFEASRRIAISSFKEEEVVTLDSFASDSIEDSDRIYSKDLGLHAGELRIIFFNKCSQPMKLPDIQSYFLFAFTIGINLYSAALLDPEEIKSMPDSPYESIGHNGIINRLFPIRGPEWLCNAANREMPFMENVFCDFQDKLIVPTYKAEPADYRLGADCIASAFLWSIVGGWYWFKEAMQDIKNKSIMSPKDLWGPGASMCQVKRGMFMIENTDLKRAIEYASSLGDLLDD